MLVMESLPSWKQDLLRKRQTQKNSLVFMSRRSVSEHNTAKSNGSLLRQASTPEAQPLSVTSENGDEHILPVTENPWLRRDPVSRKRLSDHRSSGHRSPSSDKRSDTSNRWSGALDGADTVNDDDVFKEEVAYGKGFVHKILLKFSHFAESEKQQVDTRSRKWSRSAKAKRSRSAENVLDSHNSKAALHSSSIEFSSPRESSASDGLSPRNDSFSPRSPTEPPSDRDRAGLGTRREGSVEDSATAELPKRNIVASTRDVFERITSPTPTSQKQVFLYPKEGVTSPRNTVHSLIAVDSASEEEASERGDSRQEEPATSSVIKDKQTESRSVVSSASSSAVQFSRKSSNDVISATPSVTLQSTSDLKPAVSSPRSHLNSNSKPTGSSQTFKAAKPVSDKHVKTSSVASTGVANGESLPKDTVALKKRKAPLPPKPAPRSPKPTSPPVVAAGSKPTPGASSAANIGSVKSKAKPDGFVYDVAQQSSTLSESVAADETKQVRSEEDVHKPARRQTAASTASAGSSQQTSNGGFRASVDALKNEVVKSSTPRPGSSNDAQAVISGAGRNRKAKIVTPKSAGPGSLLIRPASNMVQSKSAQMARLEFKYDDIRTGDFAPPNKKPAYYDEDDSDADVTDGEATSTSSSSKTDGDKRKSKSGKYEFVGAGVIAAKSSLSKKKRDVKVRAHLCNAACYCTFIDS